MTHIIFDINASLDKRISASQTATQLDKIVFFSESFSIKRLRLIFNGQREWYNGSIVAFQAIDPGSTPGSRTLFKLQWKSALLTRQLDC